VLQPSVRKLIHPTCN